MSAPPVVVFRSEPETMVEMAKFDDVAADSVVLPVTFNVPPTAALPEASIVVEAVPPNAAVFAVERLVKLFVELALVVVSPPLKAIKVLVAFEGKRYAKLA